MEVCASTPLAFLTLMDFPAIYSTGSGDQNKHVQSCNGPESWSGLGGRRDDADWYWPRSSGCTVLTWGPFTPAPYHCSHRNLEESFDVWLVVTQSTVHCSGPPPMTRLMKPAVKICCWSCWFPSLHAVWRLEWTHPWNTIRITCSNVIALSEAWIPGSFCTGSPSFIEGMLWWLLIGCVAVVVFQFWHVTLVIACCSFDKPCLVMLSVKGLFEMH